MDIFPDWSEISSTAKLIHCVIWLVGSMVTHLVLRHWRSHLSLPVRLIVTLFVAVSLGFVLLLSLHLVNWRSVLFRDDHYSRGHYCPEGCPCGRVFDRGQ